MIIAANGPTCGNSRRVVAPQDSCHRGNTVPADNYAEWIRKQGAAYKRKTEADPQIQRMIA